MSSIVTLFAVAALLSGVSSDLWPWDRDHLPGQSRLLANLLRSVHSGTRPVWNQSEPVEVYLSVSIQRLELRDIDGRVRATLLLRLEWIDDQLSWKPLEEGMSSLSLPSDSIWTPDIYCVNGVTLVSEVDPILRVEYARVTLIETRVLEVSPSDPSPGVKLLHPGTVQLDLEFRSWNYDKLGLELHYVAPEQYKIDHSSVSEVPWVLYNTWVTESITVKEPDGICCAEELSSVKVHLLVKLIRPINLAGMTFALMTFLPLVTFWLPSRYKILYMSGVLTLLILLIGQGHLVSLAGFSITYSVMTMITTLLGINLHYKTSNRLSVSPKIKKVMLQLAKTLRIDWPDVGSETSLDTGDKLDALNSLAVRFKVKGQLLQRAAEWRAAGTSNRHQVTKRAAILSSPSEPISILSPLIPATSRSRLFTLTPEPELLQNNHLNNADVQRVTFPDQEVNLVRFPNEASTREQRTLEGDEGRKASPDVQDIIDGIVKLLGGKVHNPVNSNRPGQLQQYIGSNPQQQFNQQRPQPPQIPLNRPYNLFNPTKPIFFPTSKPNRINSRGPPIPIPTEQQQQQFEAIPLELLHYPKNVSLGPPFALTPIKGHGAEAPYQLGVPLPQQLVPAHTQPHHEAPRPLQNQIQYHRPQAEFTNLPEPPKSLPVSKPSPDPLPSPIQSQLQTDSIEDDERDAERLSNIADTDKNRMWIPYGSTEAGSIGTKPILLEPTITEESQLPSFAHDSAPTTPFSTMTESTSTSSHTTSVVGISPTKTSGIHNEKATTALHGGDNETDVTPVGTLKGPVFNGNRKNIGVGTSTSLGQINRPTPPLRPGIVLPDETPKRDDDSKAGFGSVEVVATDVGGGEKIADVFDVTVRAQQTYGNQPAGQPIIHPVDLVGDEIITAPNGHQQFVSINGKRTYFNLHSTSSSSLVGHPSATTAPPPMKSHPGIVGPPSHPFAPPSPRPVSNPTTALNKNVGTSLKITNSEESNVPTVSKTPPDFRRLVTRRPATPPVRIDTCIVGDDTTCNVEQFESCRTENGVSSCMCRPGYARKRHRETCKAIVALVLSLRLDKLGDKKLNYNPDYFNPNSELYQSLEWETIHGLDSIFGDSSPSPNGYIGSRLDAIGFDGRHAVVNSTVLLQEVPNIATSQVKRDVQRQLFESITRHHNGLGKSQLTVEGPISAINAIADMNECDNPEMHDCDSRAQCVNTYGSYECKCNPGYGDKFEKDKRRSGRKCESCNAKVYCNGRGECLIENGKTVCKCGGNYYGSQCDIDGEVLAVAIGASVSAVVIIGLTLACLCMWSRRWKREEQKAAIMSRTLFGGVASQAMSYLGKNTLMQYQQHMTLDERLRWAQVDPSLPGGNLYVQTEPLSYETPPQMLTSSARRSAETCDTTLDDVYEDNRHHLPNIKRPKSRSSQLHYCDLDGEPQSDIYAAHGPPFMPAFPAQFCVPTSPMNPYPHSRGGFYS